MVAGTWWNKRSTGERAILRSGMTELRCCRPLECWAAHPEFRSREYCSQPSLAVMIRPGVPIKPNMPISQISRSGRAASGHDEAEVSVLISRPIHGCESVMSGGYGHWEPGFAGEGCVDGVGGADAVSSCADQVGADPAVVGERGGGGVPVSGDGLVSFRAL